MRGESASPRGRACIIKVGMACDKDLAVATKSCLRLSLCMEFSVIKLKAAYGQQRDDDG